MPKQKGETSNMTPLAAFAKAFIDGVLLAFSVYLSLKDNSKKH